MRHNPERLAWTVLLISFAACVTLAIGAPLLTRWWIDTAYVDMQVVAQSVQRGTVRLMCEGEADPVAVEPRDEPVCRGNPRAGILTDVNDQGTFVVRAADSVPQPLVEIHIDGNSQMKILYARAPRFSLSSQPYTLGLQVDSGRVRVSTLGNAARPVVVQALAPDTLVQMDRGSASVQANTNETRVSVHAGAALVVWNSRDVGVPLGRSQSVVVPPPDGALKALPPAQNLIANGDFSAPLSPAWQTYSKDIEVAGEPRGEFTISNLEGNTIVGLARVGRGHAETGMTQRLDLDVQTMQSLELRLVLRVLEQDVPVCGTQGTECPLMAKLEYLDAQGNVQNWLQGFYASLDPNRVNPPYCTVCNPRADHLRVPQGAWHVYNSPNLIALFSQAGSPPVSILSVTLYASGHTYRSEVSLVELLAQ